jgi:hypothetical protein
MDVGKIPFVGMTQYVSKMAGQSGLAPSQRLSEMEAARSILTEKYGPGSIDETFIPVARENARTGMAFGLIPGQSSSKFQGTQVSTGEIFSPVAYGHSNVPFVPLGKNAINGTLGGILNIQA